MRDLRPRPERRPEEYDSPKVEQALKGNGKDECLPGSEIQGSRRTEMEKQALELRRDGKGYDQIAEILKVELSTAAVLVRAPLRRLRKDVGELAYEVRALDLQRLDGLWSKFFPLARDDGSIPAGQMCLAILKRRAEMLGLDVPPRLHIEHRKLEVSQHIITFQKDLEQLDATALYAEYREAIGTDEAGSE